MAAWRTGLKRNPRRSYHLRSTSIRFGAELRIPRVGSLQLYPMPLALKALQGILTVDPGNDDLTVKVSP